MKPLSRKKRLTYLISFTLFFVASVPALIFYANGYEFSDLGLIKTGGIYITTPSSGTHVYINNKFYDESSMFQKTFFIKNLRPNTYTISTKQEGHQSWTKMIAVTEKQVSTAYPFMLPLKPIHTLITPFVDISGTPTTTRSSLYKTNEEYTYALSIFAEQIATSTTIKILRQTNASTTSIQINGKFFSTQNKVSIWIADDKVHAYWNGQLDSAPSYFCTKTICVREFIIATELKQITALGFLPGRDDVILLSTKQKIYAIELDRRMPQNSQLIYSGTIVDFRINERGNIYVRDSKKIFFMEI